MRHNKNDSRDSQKNRGTTPLGSTSWSPRREKTNNNDSEYDSPSEGRYTELPEHDLQGSRGADRWSSSRSDRNFNSDRDYRSGRDSMSLHDNDHSSSQGKYTQYRDDNYEDSNRYQQNQKNAADRYAAADRGPLNRDFGYGAAGNYSDYYRPSERSMGSMDSFSNRSDYGTGSRVGAYRSADSDLDSDSYRGQNLGSDSSAGHTYSSQNSTSGKYAGRGPKGYTRTDERIREEVCDTLTRHPSIDASEIECEVKEGEVTLKGTVPERNMKWMAERVICDCQGVKDVNNQIKVQRDTMSQKDFGDSSLSSTNSTKSMGDKKSGSAKNW